MITQPLVSAAYILCFSLPILAILFYRLYRHASLIALMLYYGLTIAHCLGSATLPPTPDFTNTWEVLYNYIEIPLMLTSLLFFCPARQRQQKVHLFIGLFVSFELGVALVAGFTPQASLYIMTPGLLVIVGYSLFLFLSQLRFTLSHGKNSGRVLMLGAIWLSYSCYLLVFYTYFIQEKSDVSGIYAIHFASSALAAVLMSAGLLLMRHRIRELQELKVTRRELQMIFG